MMVPFAAAAPTRSKLDAGNSASAPGFSSVAVASASPARAA